MTIKIKTILKNLLHENDLTAAQLARATKIPPQTINNWLSGQEPRSLNQIKAVADHFGISVDYLVYGSSIKKSCLKENLIEPIAQFEEEINAGVFEVVLRRVKK